MHGPRTTGVRMPGIAIPERRRSKRVSSKNRASVVAHLNQKVKRFPCLVVDKSDDGFRLKGTIPVKRGHLVEVIFEDDPLRAVRCNVVWVGKAGSKQEGEAGLTTA